MAVYTPYVMDAARIIATMAILLPPAGLMHDSKIHDMESLQAVWLYVQLLQVSFLTDWRGDHCYYT